MIQIRKNRCATLALLCAALLAGCALANHPSGAPLDGAGTMPTNPCVSPDYPLGEMTPTDPHLRKLKPTESLCGADYVVEGDAREVTLPVGAGKVGCAPVTAYLYYSAPDGMTAYIGVPEKNYVARPLFGQAGTIPLPTGAKKTIVMQIPWSCEPTAAGPVIRMFGQALAGTRIHRWWIIPRAAPRGAPVVYLPGVDRAGPDAAGRR